MTPEQWRSAREPQTMLELLLGSGRASERKLRLYACACLRHVWPLLKDPRSQAAVEAAERFADGDLGPDGLQDAHRAAVSVSIIYNRPEESAAYSVASPHARDAARVTGRVARAAV